MKKNQPLLCFLYLAILILPKGVGAQAGILDPSFGTSGITVTNYALQVSAMAIQSDGKILVAGIYNETAITIMRYTANGVLDNNFGTGGGGLVSTPIAIYSMPGSTETYMSIVSILVTPDRILLGGDIANDHTPVAQMVVLGYTFNGDIDSTFGVNGIAYNDTTQWNYGAPCTYPYYMYSGGFLALQSDGKIIQAGTANCSSNGYFSVCRYNQGGTKDTSFQFLTSMSNPLFVGGACGVTLLPDNTIVIGGSGYGFGANSGISVPRYVCIPASGNLSDLPQGASVGGAIGVDSSTVQSFIPNFICTYQGTCLLGGTMTSQNNISQFGVARLSASIDSLSYVNTAPLDVNFGNSGIFTQSLGINGGTLNSGIIQPDGKLLLAGSRNSGGITLDDIEIMRLTTSGTLDPSFGTGGIVTTNINDGDDFSIGIGLQNGKIIVVGATTNPSDDPEVLVLRYSNDITGITQIAEPTVGVFPNPARERVSITLSENLIGVEISLSDVTGRIISISKAEGQQENISLHTLSSGIYFLTIHTAQGSITKKVIKD